MFITSVNNKNVMKWAKLSKAKYQRQYQQFIIEEKLLIEEAKKANLSCTTIVREDSGLSGDFIVTDAIMKKISNNESLNDIIAVCDFYKVEPKNLNKIVYLDNVQDPGNVGTIIRSAHAFGFDQVVLANNTVNKYNSKLVSAAKGSMFHLSVVDDLSLSDYLKKGYKIYATALDSEAVTVENIKDSEKMIVVFGNEGQGVSSEILALASEKVYIEMNNFDSLNVAISAGIVLHHFKVRNEE